MTDLKTWISALETELGLPPGTIDMNEVLDLARDAAHAVARPAAPVTTYAVGYAAGLAAASGERSDAARRAITLAHRWPEPIQPG
ncbi:DUF6457 domain-containing protein [Myceligenerans crystallogenes]|uniref:DUF6457 domain-containing protein n=1 Tax=Myceligenerans crystallogenes TaxID=316335 RepID=A0ABP4ZDT0_9MICO